MDEQDLMMMVMPTADNLRSYMAEATEDCTEQVFINRYLNAVYQILVEDPRQYRAYGVFWWAIKQAFIERDVFDFGYEVDASAIAIMAGLNTAQRFCAAFANKQYAVDNGHLYSCDHVYDGSNGEPYFYSLDDFEMEQRIAGNIE